MYRIYFYEDKNYISELRHFIDDLWEKSASSKDARIQYDQIIHQIELLADRGTNQSVNYPRL